MVRIVIGLVLLGHGIGHSMGIIQVFKVAAVNPSWDGRSWLLTAAAGTAVTQAVGVMLWSVATVGFVALAGVVFGWLPESWWVPLGVISSIASLVGLVLFPLAFPTFSTLGALAVDIVVLVAVVWYHWVPSDLAA
jgi:hypothetical protein